LSLDSTTEQLVSSKSSVLSLSIKEKVDLFAYCMHYVKGDGWFIPANKPFNMGDEVRKKIGTVLGSALKFTYSTNSM
jgi:Tfp pilus assembly protein PilZ